MKHYGDITKINGAEAPVVDIITGGSPCQDLSVAGKRAGLTGERSGLFMEQMRIVKEMRERERATGRAGWMVRPRYMVWENVPGAFSSGNPKGADFAAVIEEIIKVAEPGASVSVCVPNGGWTKSGCYYAEDGSWSIAWRVHDAQFWGVPQRRKRIALVCDFGGLSAPEILFERKGLSGDSEQSGAKRKEAAGAVGGGAEGAGFGETGIGYWQNGIQTLRAEGENRPSRPSNVIVSVHAKQDPTFVCAGFKHKASGTARSIGYEEEKAPSLIAGQESAVYDARGNGDCFLTPERHTSLTAGGGQAGQGYPCVLDERGAIFYDAYQHHGWRRSETSGTLTVGQNNTVRGDTPLVAAYGISSYSSNSMKSPNPHSGIYEADTARTLDLNGGSPACNQGGIAVVQSVGCDVYNHKGCGERQGVEREVVCSWDGTQIAPTFTANNAGGSQRMPDKDNFNAVLQYAPDTAHALHGKANCQFREDSETYVAAVDCRNGTENPNINGTLQAKSTGGTGTNFNNVLRANAIVRRLTPLECERLQGYPDGWTDIGEWVDSNGKKHGEADSPRYKALGNSIALPFWQWMARRICAQYERPVTMASLFDGIGGFPLVFQRCGAVPVWASEIEEFPIAVTKVRFPDESV